MKQIVAFDFDGTITNRDTLLEFIKFAVDLDADRLETARSRMLRRIVLVFRNRAGYQIRQLRRALDRGFFTRTAYGARDLSGKALFTVVAQDAGDVGLRCLCKPLRGRQSAGRIHAHVERPVHAK